MKDGLEYAEMLGLGVSQCDVVVKPAKRRKKKDVKKQVIEKVNAETEFSAEVVPAVADAEAVEISSEKSTENAAVENLTYTARKTDKRKKFFGKKFKFDIVYAEGVAAFVLVVAILLTNIFWENSGMNTLFKKAFGKNESEADTRTYSSFNAQSPSSDLEVSVSGGVMTFSGKGTMYPVCDGTVASVVEEEGKYTVTIDHSDVFTTVISGVDYVYADKGEPVYRYIPVCYLSGGDAKVYMYNGDALLTDYIVEDGSIIWES